MTNVPGGKATDDARRGAEPARWPVLAQLPDATANSLSTERYIKPAQPGGAEYRFDPPQLPQYEARTDGASRSASYQPHLFENRRRGGQRGIPKRNSSVLPHANPFSNPRPQLLDSLAPAIRFLTIAALITAVGVWAQMLGRPAPSATKHPAPLQTTITQPTVAPQKNAESSPVPPPTATGPIGTQPEAGARVGQVENNDFAGQKNSATGPVSFGGPSVSPPHFLISSVSSFPRVRLSDTKATGLATPQVSAGAANATAIPNVVNGASKPSSVARIPGFLMDLPTR